MNSSADPQPQAVRPRCDGHTHPAFKCEEIKDEQRQQALDAYWSQGHREGRWAFEAQSVQSVSRSILFSRSCLIMILSSIDGCFAFILE